MTNVKFKANDAKNMNATAKGRKGYLLLKERLIGSEEGPVERESYGMLLVRRKRNDDISRGFRPLVRREMYLKIKG